MEFRWIAVLALWTILIGPMLDAPQGRSKAELLAAKEKGQLAERVDYNKKLMDRK